MLRYLLMSESQNGDIVPKMAKLMYSLDSWHCLLGTATTLCFQQNNTADVLLFLLFLIVVLFVVLGLQVWSQKSPVHYPRRQV